MNPPGRKRVPCNPAHVRRLRFAGRACRCRKGIASNFFRNALASAGRNCSAPKHAAAVRAERRNRGDARRRERLGVSVTNVVAGKSTKRILVPRLDAAHEFRQFERGGVGVYLQGDPVFQIVPGEHNERYEADRDVLRSGWLVGEQVIAKKAAMVIAHQGQGRVVLIGFRAQHRSQTYGTFKLLFNALIG
jgi:hypothetical protein